MHADTDTIYDESGVSVGETGKLKALTDADIEAQHQAALGETQRLASTLPDDTLSTLATATQLMRAGAYSRQEAVEWVKANHPTLNEHAIHAALQLRCEDCAAA